MKVLIADGSRAMRRIVAAMLKEAGFRKLRIVEAVDGKDGLSKALAETPDVVISDWNMPNMTGIAFLRTLRDLGIAVPFGFLTTEVSPEMRALAEAAGAAFLIGKPCTPTDFVRVLDGYLDRAADRVLPHPPSPIEPDARLRAALADNDRIAKHFSTTLRRAVTATVVEPLAESSLLVGGHYVNGAGRVVAGCFADKALAAHAGAALSLVPATVALESIAAEQLDEVLLENFAEVLNICSRLFDRGSLQRITLRTIEASDGPRSGVSLAMLRQPAKRHDVELDIAGYGTGRLVLAVLTA